MRNFVSPSDIGEKFVLRVELLDSESSLVLWYMCSMVKGWWIWALESRLMMDKNGFCVCLCASVRVNLDVDRIEG